MAILYWLPAWPAKVEQFKDHLNTGGCQTGLVYCMCQMVVKSETIPFGKSDHIVICVIQKTNLPVYIAYDLQSIHLCIHCIAENIGVHIQNDYQCTCCCLDWVGINWKVCAMWLIGNRTYFHAIKNNCTCNSHIALSFASCSYSTVTRTIIL